MKIGKMKMILILVLAIAVGALSQGCGSDDYGDDDVINNNDEEYEEEYEDEEEYDDEDIQADTKRVGNSEHGFVNIPSDWINYSEISDGATETQYSKKDGSAIITLFANREPVGDAETTATIAMQNAEANSPEILEMGLGEMAGYEAHQVWMEYADGAAGFLWFFESEEGCINSIALGATEGELQGLSDLIVESFGLYE